MVDVKKIIAKVSSIAAIDAYYESINKQRSYLGLSQVGHKCPRWLWYKHRGRPETPIKGRVLRLFELGNIVEDQLFLDFARAGFTISDAQKEVSIYNIDVKLTGHIDGIITGLLESNQPHLWECKSMNNKGFQKLKKHGYEAYNPQYKMQIHVYTLLLNLSNIFVVVYNKDTSELYQERIKIKKAWVIEKLQDIFAAITQDHAPDRNCPRCNWYEAAFCGFFQECWRRP